MARDPAPKAQLREERTRSGITGWTTGAVGTSKHAQHVHPPRGRALLPVGTTGVPPRAKMHPRLEPATPMSWHRRMSHYLGHEDGTMADLTGPQRRRMSKKLNHEIRLRAEHRLAAKMSTPAAASRDIPDVAAGHTPGFVIKWGKNALKLARRT